MARNLCSYTMFYCTRVAFTERVSQNMYTILAVSLGNGQFLKGRFTSAIELQGRRNLLLI